MNGDSHIHISAAQLRRAYEQRAAIPGYGGWRRDDDERVYRCPLNLLYGAGFIDEAVEASSASWECVSGFLAGWDGKEKAMPNECTQCFELGADLRAQLKPVRI
jgi:hypothetical protein